jgi:hypothetical protein
MGWTPTSNPLSPPSPNSSELRALIDATYRAPQIAPGLSAWIEALERLRELVLPQGGGHRQQQIGGGDEGSGAHRAA